MGKGATLDHEKKIQTPRKTVLTSQILSRERNGLFLPTESENSIAQFHRHLQTRRMFLSDAMKSVAGSARDAFLYCQVGSR